MSVEVGFVAYMHFVYVGGGLGLTRKTKFVLHKPNVSKGDKHE